MKSPLQLVNVESDTVIVPQLKLAATFWTRFRGLQFRRELPIGEGLLIAPCRSIHTHWMRFAIDVVMIDVQGVVLKVQPNLRAWRTCAGPSETRFVLEVPAETTRLKIGDQIAIRQDGKTGQTSLPAVVHSLLSEA